MEKKTPRLASLESCWNKSQTRLDTKRLEELAYAEAEFRKSCLKLMKHLVPKLDEKFAHFCRLFLLHPMPGSVNEVRAQHPCTRRFLHPIEVSGVLVDAPVVPSSNKKCRGDRGIDAALFTLRDLPLAPR